jgi:hypothetical protein
VSLNFASCFRLNEPNPDPAPRIVVEEADPRLLKRGLDAHQGLDMAHSKPWRRLFGLFCPRMFAQSHTRAAAVLVDEIK